jgi:ABC-type Fe3+/spermidine/putrescine transport system ATPase subunit
MVYQMARSHVPLETSISLQGISKVYQGKRVIDNLSLDLHEGEFLSLLGPSGSGKTTLLRIVAGLATPDQGQMQRKGQDLKHVPPYERRMGMVFQQYALFPHLTVEENVAYGLKAQRLDRAIIRERVQRYLDLVGLTHLAKRKPRELSGGQQQRVSLARALAVEPVVLLFDEPLSNLDVRLKEQMMQEIHQLHRTLGFTAIYVTHDQKEALYLSDRIAVLHEGKIEQLGTPEEILQRPASAFVADFFGYTNRFSPVRLMDAHRAYLGEFEIAVGHTGKGVQPGAEGLLLFNAHAFQLQESSGTIAAKVVEGRHLGGKVELRLQLVAEPSFTFVVEVPLMQRIPEAGSTVYGHFRPDGVCFFEKEDAS